MNKWNENNVIGVKFHNGGSTHYIIRDIGNNNVAIDYINGGVANQHWGTAKDAAKYLNQGTWYALEEPKNQEFNIWN